MVVVTMEKTPFLVTMHRVVGGVEVENQFLGWSIKGGDEALHQHPVDRPRRPPIGPVLKPAQRRRAGQRPVALNRRLQGQVVAQRIMVVQIAEPSVRPKTRWRS